MSAFGGSGGGLSSSALLSLQARHAEVVARLEADKAASEKRAQRLKEVFGAKVMEFRATCYALTGYKIELVQGSYRLKSMYAEAEGDHLLFRQTPDPAGTAATPAAPADKLQHLEVLETDFTARLDSSITAYLSKMHSIPAFLAAVQLDLVEKQTKVR